MNSMPFPHGTWNFLVVPQASGAANRLIDTWGLMTFQASGGHTQLALQVGLDTSSSINVTWSSVAPDVGTITSNPSFTVGGHTYAFTSITIFTFQVAGSTVAGADHRIAFCIHVTVDQTQAWFVALPNTSALLPPEPGDYVVTQSGTGMPLSVLTATAGDDIQVTAPAGY